MSCTKPKFLLFKATVTWQTKWKWSHFLGLTLFEFTNYDKNNFPLQEHLQIFPTSLAKWKMCASLQFRVVRDPENILSVWRRELYGPGPWFLLLDKHEYTHGIFRSVILVSIFVTGLCNFFFALQDLIAESILVFREELFKWTCFLLYVTKTFPLKISSLTGMGLRILLSRNYGGKSPVCIKYHNLHYFKEMVILLCQSILKTRRISRLHGSALFIL